MLPLIRNVWVSLVSRTGIQIVRDHRGISTVFCTPNLSESSVRTTYVLAMAPSDWIDQEVDGMDRLGADSRITMYKVSEALKLCGRTHGSELYINCLGIFFQGVWDISKG